MIELRLHRPNSVALARFGTALVARALGKDAGRKGMNQTAAAAKLGAVCGQVVAAQAWFESDLPLISRLAGVPSGAIVYIEAIQCAERSVIGEAMIRYLFEEREITALVVDGNIRDLARVDSFPIWFRGTSPSACTSHPVRPPLPASIVARRGAGQPDPSDAICLADRDGVVLVPRGLASMVEAQAENLEIESRIQHACLEAGMDPIKALVEAAWQDPAAISGPEFEEVRTLTQMWHSQRMRQAN